MARPQGEQRASHSLLFHPRTTRAHPRLARIAAFCRRRAHRVLRLELWRRDGGADSASPREVRPVNLLRRLQSVDAQGRRHDEAWGFMRTIEWEMPYWNWGQAFDYAELAYLMVPRPFMVERGHLDLVGRDQWVAHEYAKVQFLYAQLGLADRTEIQYFQGGHSFNGQAPSSSCTSTFAGRRPGSGDNAVSRRNTHRRPAMREIFFSNASTIERRSMTSG